MGCPSWSCLPGPQNIHVAILVLNLSKHAGSGVIEPLLEVSETHTADRGVNAASGHQCGSGGPFAKLLHMVKCSFSACVTKLAHCMDWLWGTRGTQLPAAQMTKLARLQSALAEPYSSEDPAHEEALKELWHACFPDEAWHGQQDKRWIDAGFQGPNPITDFRGGGVFSLFNLVYMARNHPDAFARLRHKKDGDKRADFEYPFCAAGINITMKLQQLLSLRTPSGATLHSVPTSPAGTAFLHLLDKDINTFQEMYVVAFTELDRLWLQRGASYMDFPSVLAETMGIMQQALQQSPKCLEDMWTKLGSLDK